MRFREWILQESGHTILKAGPQDIIVMYNGKPTTFHKILMIDPKFEFQNVPKPDLSKSKNSKFIGETEFSLPILSPQGKIVAWIVSQRDSMFSGTGFIQRTPKGVLVPINWANHAQLIDVTGKDATSQLAMQHAI